jgi:hypothetical protein
MKAMMNFDMVGRLKSDTRKLTVGGSGTSAESDSLLNLFHKKEWFELHLSPEGYGPSDHASFYKNNIPVFFFTTGAHEDYHTPFDDVDKLDLASEANILQYASGILKSIAVSEKALTYKEAGPAEASTGRGFKVTLGIIPDVAATDNKGLGVDGVKKGGPADLGGIKKGDIITGMDGNKVTNVYDYMGRLNKLKAGQTVVVEVQRQGKTEVLLIQL